MNSTRSHNITVQIAAAHLLPPKRGGEFLQRGGGLRGGLRLGGGRTGGRGMWTAPAVISCPSI